jgi:hypothetical protein
MDLAKAKEIIECKLRRRGYTIVYRKTLSGRVSCKRRICSMCDIKSRRSLYIACHELYHALRDRPKHAKVYVNEMQAERFAHRFMRHLGFSVPRGMTRRAKRYVLYKATKAQRRGLKKVDSSVTRFIGDGSSVLL